MTQSRLNSADLLVPAFWERLQAVLKAVRGQGYHPVLFETLRSRERALELSKRGTGVVDSMHMYGIAADIICGDHQWDCRRHQCAFYEALGIQAEDMGLTWGGRWKRVDLPHIQCVPVRFQDRVRKCQPEHLDAMCRAVLANEVR